MAAANAVVDRHQHDRTGEDGDGRRDLRHMLGFDGAERAPFVNMLAHPRVAGYLNTIVGRGYRMGPPRPSPPSPAFLKNTTHAHSIHPRLGCRDRRAACLPSDHAPTLITMEQGDPAAALHGSSGYDSWTGEPGFNPLEYYVWRNGQMHNGLTVAAFQLVDVSPGDGGLGVIPCAPLLFALDAVSQTTARTPLLLHGRRRGLIIAPPPATLPSPQTLLGSLR